MPTYTLVVRVPDEMTQDALIEAVDGCGSLSDMRGAEVVFCGPGSLVQDCDPEDPVEREVRLDEARIADEMERESVCGISAPDY